MNIEIMKRIILLVKKIFPFIINDVKFSPKWKITLIELISCFKDAMAAFTFVTGLSTAIFYDYLSAGNWKLLLLNGFVFLGFFLYKFIPKLKRDGSIINYNIHKSLLDQSEEK